MKGGVMRAIFNLTSLGTLSQVEKDAAAISPVVRLWDKYLQKFNLKRIIADEDFRSFVRFEGTQCTRIGSDHERY